MLLNPAVQQQRGDIVVAEPGLSRAAGLALPPQPRSLPGLAEDGADTAGREHEHAGHDLDPNTLTGIVD